MKMFVAQQKVFNKSFSEAFPTGLHYQFHHLIMRQSQTRAANNECVLYGEQKKKLAPSTF